MKKEIRLILDGKKPATPRIGRPHVRIVEAKTPASAPKRGAFHRSVVYEQAKKPAHYLGSIADTQTPEQRRERELEAELKAQQSAAAILMRRLANARPTGERCVQRACPYPAVLDGQCRRHVTDRAQTESLLQSQLGKGAVFLT